MVRRVVSDVMWRARWIYLSGAAFLLPAWVLYARIGPDFREFPVPALSMTVAAGLGPLFAMSSMGARVLRHLPLTGRDLRLVTWIIATIVPTALLCVLKILSVLIVTVFGATSKLSAQTIVLSAVFDFAWTGTLLYLWLRLDAAVYAASDWGLAARACGATGSLLVVLGGIAAPMALSDLVPARVDAMAWPAVAGLAAGVALNVAALRWVPSRGTFAGDRPRAWWRPAAPAVSISTRRIDRLTGLSRIAVPYLLWMLALPAAAAMGLAGYGLVAGRGAWWFVPPNGLLVNPADGEVSFVVLIPALVGTMIGAWTTWARVLRMVPLSVRQINALLVLTPFVTWMLLMTLLNVGFSLARGLFVTPRLDLVLGLAGIAAFAHAFMLRYQGSSGRFWVIVMTSSLISKILEAGIADGTHVWFAAVGGLAAIAAIGVNHATLTQSTSSSAPYRRPQTPFGPPAAPGPG